MRKVAGAGGTGSRPDLPGGPLAGVLKESGSRLGLASL